MWWEKNLIIQFAVSRSHRRKSSQCFFWKYQAQNKGKEWIMYRCFETCKICRFAVALTDKMVRNTKINAYDGSWCKLDWSSWINKRFIQSVMNHNLPLSHRWQKGEVMIVFVVLPCLCCEPVFLMYLFTCTS